MVNRGPAWREHPDYYRDEPDDDDARCTHCGGEGLCAEGADPLGDCPDELHRCHACGGSGEGRDQVIW